MNKHMTAALAAVLTNAAAGAASGQARLNVNNPQTTVGDVDSGSRSRANQSVTGLDATVVFEAAEIPGKTKTTVKSTPDAIAPSIVGGNPCMISASVGGSGVGFGFGVGIGVEDEGCETRQVVALMSNMGDRQAAFLHLCMHNSQVQETVKAAGFETCQAYAGIITPGAARLPGGGVTSQVSTPGVVTPPVVIQNRPSSGSRPASTSVTLTAPEAPSGTCTDQEYDRLLRNGSSWGEYSPACRFRHANG